MRIRQLKTRRISPLGLDRQRKRSPRQTEATGAKREIWAKRSVYRWLLFIFRPRPGSARLVPPFLSNRPLTKAEFFDAQELYDSQRRRRRDRFAPKVTKRDALLAAYPYFNPPVDSNDWEWASHILIGKALFATSKLERKRLYEQALKDKVFISGPVERRKFLKKAWRALPQVKAELSAKELQRLRSYRRGCEFLCAFLMGEARALAEKGGGPVTQNIPTQAETLAQHYPYLGLTVDEIRAYLINPAKQPDVATAAKFGISPSYVRRLL